MNGAFRIRLAAAWIEIRENLGRSTLQALGIMLGVASVLGGFSISDSQRRRADELFAKLGGFDKLNVMSSEAVKDGKPSALQTANLGLRFLDAEEGEDQKGSVVEAVSVTRNARSRVRSATADQERMVNGIGRDYLDLDGYTIREGRAISNEDFQRANAVAVLGDEAAKTFFPEGNAVGKTMKVGDIPVTVIGVLEERVFRFRKGQNNIFRRRNRIIAVPATLVSRRMQGDAYQRLDRVTFRVPKMEAMADFAKDLDGMLRANHRGQQDFRLDDVAARIRRQRSQGDVYNMIFMLSGVLALFGGGLVNVNIQMAALKERVREVGVKMAIGAGGKEIFKEFMTEALLLTGLGGLGGLLLGVGFSATITGVLGVPLYMAPISFVSAFLMAAVFGLLFALYPAFKASRLSPMEALRYE
ncbi:MAG: ABC transporter permease [Acidobacteria bacterium]|nr:ABC transporter permease [Acidobacteriota bacterium]